MWENQVQNPTSLGVAWSNFKTPDEVLYAVCCLIAWHVWREGAYIDHLRSCSGPPRFLSGQQWIHVFQCRDTKVMRRQWELGQSATVTRGKWLRTMSFSSWYTSNTCKVQRVTVESRQTWKEEQEQTCLCYKGRCIRAPAHNSKAPCPSHLSSCKSLFQPH